MKYYILLFILGVLVSCKKEEIEIIEEESAPTGKLWMHFHSTFGNIDIENLNQIYTNNQGKSVSFEKADLIISEVELIKLNDESIVVKNILLKTIGQESYLIGDVPVGNYKTVKFKFGVSANSNNQISDTSMWINPLNEAEGYWFLNTKGSIDTSSNNSNQFANFTYKIGGIENIQSINLPDNNFPVYEGIISYVHLNANYLELFRNLDLTNSTNLSLVLKDYQATNIAIDINSKISSSFFSYE